MFNRMDLIITPTTPIPPPTFSGLARSPGDLRPKEIIMLRNTRPFNVYGLPSISVPCGFTRSGLPIGIQISGASGAEGSVLSLAGAYQKETDWHTRLPTMG